MTNQEQNDGAVRGMPRRQQRKPPIDLQAQTPWITPKNKRISSLPAIDTWHGCRVSFLMDNAKRLTRSKDGAKVIDFVNLLRQSKWPSLVVITEIDGVAGKTDLRLQLGKEVCKLYQIRYTMRSIALDGVSTPRSNLVVGGGVALLVHRRLQVSIRDVNIPGVAKEDLKWTDGHLRVYRLDPDTKAFSGGCDREFALRRPMYVTTAYFPPQDHNGWGRKTRHILFSALAASNEQIDLFRQSQGVFTVNFEHINAPDNGCDLPLPVDAETVARVALLMDKAGGSSLKQTQGATVETLVDGSFLLRRRKHSAKRLRRLDKAMVAQGTDVSVAAARAGNISLSGVMGARQSTSWTPCSNCFRNASRVVCRKKQCGKMRACHDDVRLPSSLVYEARVLPSGGRDLLRYRTRRWMWNACIDHAVSTGFFFVHPINRSIQMARAAAAQEVVTTRAPKRRKFSNVLAERNNTFELIRDNVEEILRESAPLDVSDINVCNDKLIDMLRQGVAAAPNPTSSAGERAEEKSVKVALRKYERTWKANHEARRARSLGTAPHLDPAAQAEAIRVLGNALRKATKTLSRARAIERARRVARQRFHAPADAWIEMEACTVDYGASPTPVFKLCSELHDDEGRLLATDLPDIHVLALADRTKVYQYRRDLGIECEQELDDALVAISEESKATLMQYPGCYKLDSYVVISATDAGALLQDIDRRRGVRRDLQNAINRFEVARSSMETRGQRVQRIFPLECARLQRDIEIAEVVKVFDEQRDTGPGVDGQPPVVLRLLSNGCVPAEVARELNEIWSTGVLPEQWREHRCLLHYKGKNSDPCCLGNYRGLGVDQLYLKVLSLIMNERLVLFLTATGGLSLSQGGFQRQRGTPEQILSLTETVRAALHRASVNLCFIDIERAYDSVLHPILWKKCIDRGINGKFLAILQAIYHNAVVVLEMAGERLPAIRIESGVMQGNPISPALFNIYIDDSIRAIDEFGQAQEGRRWGLSLPRVAGWGDARPRVSEANQQNQLDFLMSLFFADDGVLLEFDVHRLQAMLDVLKLSLARVGLLLNVGKTKWMVIARLSINGTDDPIKAPVEKNGEYQREKESMVRQHHLHIDGQAIKLVDYFDYLGLKVSWRWSHAAAWRDAVHKGHQHVYNMQRGGFQHTGLALADQLAYVRGKVACHFNYVAAVAGAGGIAHRATKKNNTAPWLGAERVMERALCAMVDFPFYDKEALKIESGTWDQQSRTANLLLRFSCKLMTMDIESTMYRAMCLSIRTMTAAQRASPATVDAELDRLHYQPWAQQLAASRQWFGLPPIDLTNLHIDVVDVLVDLRSDGAYEPLQTIRERWTPHQATHLDAYFQLVQCPVRLVPRPLLGAKQPTLIDGVNCWLPPVNVPVSMLLKSWSPSLRSACYAALKQRGNSRRQQLVRAMFAGIDENKEGGQGASLRRWRELKTASYLEPYWYLPDCAQARQMLKLRMDCLPLEDNLRRRPSRKTPPVANMARHCRERVIYPRLDRPDRACYQCDGIDDVCAPGVFWPETPEHLLLKCPAYSEQRANLLHQLCILAKSPATVEVERVSRLWLSPTFDEGDMTTSQIDTALWTALRLSTGVRAYDAVPQWRMRRMPVVPSPNGAHIAADRDVHWERALLLRASPEFQYDHQTAVETTAWVRALCDDWMEHVRRPQVDVDADTRPGALLVRLVAAFLWQICGVRRRHVRMSDDFMHRRRDPDRSGGANGRTIHGRDDASPLYGQTGQAVLPSQVTSAHTHAASVPVCTPVVQVVQADYSSNAIDHQESTRAARYRRRLALQAIAPLNYMTEAQVLFGSVSQVPGPITQPRHPHPIMNTRQSLVSHNSGEERESG